MALTSTFHLLALGPNNRSQRETKNIQLQKQFIF